MSVSLPPPAADPAAALEPFAEPRRLHPLTTIVEALRRLPAFLVPIVVFTLTQDRGELGWIGILVIVGVLSVFRPTLRYLTVRYHVADGRLVIHEGVFVRTDRSIPAERIQNIDIRRALIHRVTGVAEMRLETAGGTDTEADLSVLSMDDAVALRSALLGLRNVRRGVESDEESDDDDTRPALVQATPLDLLVAGATETRIGLIVAAIFGLLEFTDLGADDFERATTEVVGATWIEDHGRLIAAGAVLLLVLAGWLVSIVLTYVTFHGFRLLRAGDDLRSRYGLLTQHEATIPLPRVQAVHLEANPLRRLVQRLSVTAHTAGSTSGDGDEGTSHPVLAPILREADVARLVRAVFPASALDHTPLRAVHPLARRRATIRSTLLLGLPTLVAALAWDGRAAWGLLAVVPVALLYGHLHYRSLGYALTDSHVLSRRGIWTRRMWVVPLEKVQTVAVHSTPFQRRLGLATVSIDTAGGHTWSRPRILDLPEAVARQVFEELSVASSRTGSLRGV